jgi:hypothetical protein
VEDGRYPRHQGRPCPDHHPRELNGGLFIYAHGFGDQRLVTPFPADPGGSFLSKVNMLFQASIIPALNGYASDDDLPAAGWYVKDSIKDIENLRRYCEEVRRRSRPTCGDTRRRHGRRR